MSEQPKLSGNEPKEIENVLRAEYEFSDEPLNLEPIDGIHDAIAEVAKTKEPFLVECNDRVTDYKVYWNDKTGTVRVGARVTAASYEVPAEYTEGESDE